MKIPSSFPMVALAAGVWALLLAGASAQGIKTWNGSTSTDWNTDSNWTSTGVPAGSDSVVIDTNSGNQPILLSGTDVDLTTGTVTVGSTSASGANTSLDIQDNELFDTTGIIGGGVDSTGRVTMTHGIWTNSAALVVGGSGTGSLNATGGGILSAAEMDLGTAAGGNGTVTLSNGVLANITGTVKVAAAAGSTGVLNIGDFGGSTTSGTLNAAAVAFGSGVGTINFNQTDTINFAAGISGQGSVNQLGSGTTTLTGANTFTGTTTVNAGGLRLGSATALGATTNSLVVNDGVLDLFDRNLTVGSLSGSGGFITSDGTTSFPALTVNQNTDTTFGGVIVDGIGTITLIKSGTGTLTLSGSNGYSGGTVINSGTLEIATGGLINHPNSEVDVGLNGGDHGGLVVSGGYVNGGAVLLGESPGSTGTALITSGTVDTGVGGFYDGLVGTGNLTMEGGLLTGTSGNIGFYLGSSGTATINGGEWDSGGALEVASSGNGTMTINGGIVTGSDVYIGFGTGTGAATVTSGELSAAEDLQVGVDGQGSLTINGGTVYSSNGSLGVNQESIGRATVSSGTWANGGDLSIGDSGTGSLEITGGTGTIGGMSFIGHESTGSGTVTVSGGLWSNDGGLDVGESGVGTLNLNDSGVVNVGYGTGVVTIADLAGSTGTLNLGTSGSAGTLEAAEIVGGLGAATVNFQQSESATFAPQLSGLLNVNQAGPGETILSGSANAYAGTTTVSSGTLAAGSNVAFGVSAVRVNGGTLLVQNGIAISNNVTLGGGKYNRELGDGADLAHAVDATSNFAGGKPDTTARLLDGTLTHAGTLQSSFAATSTASNDAIRLSDVYQFQGTGTDVFVLQLSVSDVDAGSYLAYLDGSGAWVNAVLGNSDDGASAHFVSGAYIPVLDDHLGYYGLDLLGGTVWAVLDHNSDYAVVSDTVPEPATWALLAMAAGLLGWRMRRLAA